MTDYNINPFGQSAVMPAGYPIANDLDTNRADKALSAAMGYKLARSSGGSQWKGKKWYAYGTSLTDTENYPSYPTPKPYGMYAKALRDMSGMIMYNKGISGGGLMNSNQNILAAIRNTTDGKTEADLITLECMINDQYFTFGNVDDVGTDSFLGCLANCIKYLQQNTTAQIVIIASPQNSRDSATNMHGTAPAGATTVQMIPTYRFVSDNRTWAERADLVRLLCEMYGVYFINPVHALGYYRKPTDNVDHPYYADVYHHTALGGYVFASYIWSILKDIPLFYTAIPT